MRVPWTARRSNESILKESSPEYPLEGLMLKLKLRYFGHLMQRADSFEKTLILGKIEGRKEEPGDPRYGVEPSQEPQQVAGIKDKNIDAGTSCPMFFLFTEVLEKVHLLTWVTTFPSISYFL